MGVVIVEGKGTIFRGEFGVAFAFQNGLEYRNSDFICSMAIISLHHL